MLYKLRLLVVHCEFESREVYADIAAAGAAGIAVANTLQMDVDVIEATSAGKVAQFIRPAGWEYSDDAPSREG